MASSPAKGARRPAPANFLEALRDLGRGVASDVSYHATRAVTADLPQAMGVATSGELKPNQTFSLADVQDAQSRGEKRAETRFGSRLAQVKEQQRLLYLRSENETKAQIVAIQQEIQLLAKSTGELAKEVQVAAFQTPANPGVYHKNFFEHLRSLIRTLRQKVQESKNWLATTNARAGKRSYYWAQVGKSGAKYMLSGERYMVTSTG